MKANAACIDGIHSHGSRNLDRSLMASLAGDDGTTADLFIIGATRLLQGLQAVYGNATLRVWASALSALPKSGLR